jgi:hypothetical protein
VPLRVSIAMVVVVCWQRGLLRRLRLSGVQQRSMRRTGAVIWIAIFTVAAWSRWKEKAWPAGVCHLEVLAEQLDRVAGERGAAAGLDPGDERQRPTPVGQQRDTVAEQSGGAAPAHLSQAVGEDPADRSSSVYS